MATTVLRNMTLGQNLHMLPTNCVIVSTAAQTPVIIQHQQSGKRPIAPALSDQQRSGIMTAIDQNRCTSSSSMITKKKLNFANHISPYGAQPASVQRRNARERNRVKQVNNGFANLRQHIPSDVITALTNGGRGASKKLSKVDTLKLAVEYIRRLQDMLDENENDALSTTSTSQHSSSSLYYSGSGSSIAHSHHSHHHHATTPPTPCSEASASPTPSYTSEASTPGTTYVHQQPSFKYEVYDAYNPEDEELLDCITWWQQQ